MFWRNIQHASQPYRYVFIKEKSLEERNINEQLMDAVSGYNLKAVQECLESDADPNYTIEMDEECPSDIIQPTTPLRLVMFRISDCLLEDNDLKQFVEIAKLLLRHGADPEPAMQVAEARYGKYDPNFVEESPFMDVWRLIANAFHKNNKNHKNT